MKNWQMLAKMPPNIRGSRSMRGVWAKGYRARKAGTLRTDCPYQSQYATQWLGGWEQAQAEIFIAELNKKKP